MAATTFAFSQPPGNPRPFSGLGINLEILSTRSFFFFFAVYLEEQEPAAASVEMKGNREQLGVIPNFGKQGRGIQEVLRGRVP